MIRKIIPLVALFGIFVTGLWLVPVSAQDIPPRASVPAVPVKLETVIRKDVPVTIKAVGNVVPMQSVAVKSRIDSQIMEVKFNDGDNVKKGDVLFVLDDRALKSQMNQIQANIQRDRAQLKNLKQQYDRALKLSGQGYATDATRDDAKAAYDAGKAVVSANEAALDNIKVQLGYTIITAPIDGRTGTINFTLGNIVKANDAQALVTINQIQPVQVQSSLPQGVFDSVRNAMKENHVTVHAVRSDNKSPIEGKLQYIDNAIDQTTGTFAVRSVFLNEDEALWPGMLVNLSIVLSESKGALIVPDVAIQQSAAGDFVFIVKDGKAAKTPVKVARIENNLALISEGLSEGDQVVTDGHLSVKDGSMVSAK